MLVLVFAFKLLFDDTQRLKVIAVPYFWIVCFPGLGCRPSDIVPFQNVV
jgi:hypothetical protein